MTRATKLMYLIEWEYFAWTREPLTSLDWIYLHYGPWSKSLSDVLREKFSAPIEEEEGKRFRRLSWTPPEFNDVDRRLKPPELEGIVQRVLETFGSEPTENIIRYVYFNTEPMQHAERGRLLDFTLTRKPLKPLNPIRSMDKSRFETLRDKLRSATEARLAARRKEFGAAPPDVLETLTQLDSPGDFSLAEGEVQIDLENKLNIAGEG